MDVVKHLSREGKSVKEMKILGLSARGGCIGALWVVTAFSAVAATNEVAVSFGDVKADARARTISFPATVNQRSGAIEYLVVHETGKVHESLFRTTVQAQQIHLAALLLSEKNTNAVAEKPQFKEPSIQVIWKDGGKEKIVVAEELILDKKKKGPLGATKWAYRGSRVVDGVFLAQRDGSIIAVMEDRDALIDQATPEASDDENWEAAPDAMPPLKSEVLIRISFGNGKAE
jgi:hypothetical protein